MKSIIPVCPYCDSFNVEEVRTICNGTLIECCCDDCDEWFEVESDEKD